MEGRVGMQTIQGLLEEALLGLRAVADPALPIRQAEEQLALALRSVYSGAAARAGAAAWRETIKSIATHLRSAVTLLTEVPTEDEGGLAELGLIQQAMEAVLRAASHPLASEEGWPELRLGTREPLQASLREPRLLEPTREVLLPAIPLPELPEPEPPPPPVPSPPPPVVTPQQLDALLAAAQARLAAFDAGGETEDEKEEEPEAEERSTETDEEALLVHFGTARTEADLLLGHARTCLIDLGMFGLMRRSRPSVPWWNGERTERRLVRRVDAIVACGPEVLPRLVKLLEERPVPDPELTWANLFLFGSIAGTDALDQALRLVRTVDLGDPAMAGAVADALSLAPHPGIEPAARAWLKADGPRERTLGLRVLARKGALQAAEALRGLEDSDLEAVRAAAQGLGRARGEVPARALAAALRHEDEETVRAALESALLRRSEAGLQRALELTQKGRGGFADAALFLAVAAGPEAAEALRQGLAVDADPTVLRALGWWGDTGFVEVLLQYLGGEIPGLKPAALEALQRLTGASLTEDGPKPGDERTPPRFLQPFEPPTPALELTDKASLWADWWEKHGRHARKGTRYRFGHEWSPRTSLWELECRDSLPLERRLAHVELAVRTGGAIPLDREDFVVRQLGQLEAWRAHVEAAARRREADGGWSTRYAR